MALQLQITLKANHLDKDLCFRCSSCSKVSEIIKRSGVLVCADYRLFSTTDSRLPEEKTLLECGVKDKDVLYLRYVSTFPLQIRRGTLDLRTEILVSGCDTIGEIKSKLTSTLGTQTACLVSNGKRLEDSKTINDYQIKPFNVVYCVPTNRTKEEIVPLQLNISGQPIRTKLPLFTPISELQSKYLENCSGWVLTNESQILSPTRSLYDYSVVEEENLYAFAPNGGKIIFMTCYFFGFTVSFPKLISETCTVGELAAAAMESSPHKYTQYVLVHKGKPDECSVQKESAFDEQKASTKLKDLKVLPEQGEIFYFFPTRPSHQGCQMLFVSLNGSQFKLCTPIDVKYDSILSIKRKLKSAGGNSTLHAALQNVSYLEMKLLYRGEELDHSKTIHTLEFLDGLRLDMTLPEHIFENLQDKASVDMSLPMVTTSKLSPEISRYEEVKRAYIRGAKALKAPKESVEVSVQTVKSSTCGKPTRDSDLHLAAELLVRAFDDAGTQVTFTNTEHSNIRMLNHRPENDVVNFHIAFNEIPGKTFEEIKKDPQIAQSLEKEMRHFLSKKLSVPMGSIVVTEITAGSYHLNVYVPKSLLNKHTLTTLSYQESILQIKQQLSQEIANAFPNFSALDTTLVSLRDQFEFSMGDFDSRGDFRFPTANGETQTRGGIPYYQPNNKWRRFGLRVLGLYQDDQWITMNGNTKEWAVGFHGPNGKVDALKGIGQTRMISLANANAYGGDTAAAGTAQARKAIPTTGIYFSQDVETCYNKEIQINGVNYKLAFQCRVDPAHVYLTGNSSKWFVVDDPIYVRPYGIVIKQV